MITMLSERKVRRMIWLFVLPPAVSSGSFAFMDKLSICVINVMVSRISEIRRLLEIQG